MQLFKGKTRRLRASSFDPKLPSLGTVQIATEPPSVFLLHKLRIQDRSLLSREGKMPPEPLVYGHSTLKDQFRAHSERFKPAKLHRSVSALEVPSMPISVKRKETGQTVDPMERTATHRVRLSRLSNAVIDQCEQFQTVDLWSVPRSNAHTGRKTVLRSFGRLSGQTRAPEKDPSSLVLRYERNNHSHRKRMIQRSRSFLQRRS